MKFPFFVCDVNSKKIIKVWNNIYAKTKGSKKDKTIEESLWRRTQDYRNKKVSGWSGAKDKRRKVVYYRHEYDLLKSSSGKQFIGLVGTYVYICLTLPEKELSEYEEMISGALKKGKWLLSNKNGKQFRTYRLGDLFLDITKYKNTNEHIFEYDVFPRNYRSLEISVRSKNVVVNEYLRKKPWIVLKSGLRRKLKRGKPKYLTDPKEIIKFFPAQIELGCGPSYEAAIPPLHELHYRYSINEPFSKKFIIRASEDLFLIELISNPARKYVSLTDIFSKIINAQLTDFYYVLKEMFNRRQLLGPVITNNFDGLHLRVGLKELYVRRYEEKNIIPKITFHPMARALIVVGSHADRRFIQEAARRQGLKIVYIDPEGWWVENKFLSYPLESPQNQDIIFKKPALNFFLELKKELFKEYKNIERKNI